MGSVELLFDAGHLRYTVPILIARPGHPQFNTEFLLDTGSNATSIDVETAEKLGLRVDALELELMGGINGLTKEPVFKGKLILYLTGNLDRVELDSVRILRTVATTAKKRIAGKVVKQVLMTSEFPNIIGMDSLMKVNDAPARIFLDLAHETGRIEW